MANLAKLVFFHFKFTILIFFFAGMLWRNSTLSMRSWAEIAPADCWRLSHSLIFMRPFSTRSKGIGDHYQVLGLHRHASQEEIKNAFYILTKKYHPDVVGSSDGTNQKFLEIREAYETLRDEQKRHQYDIALSDNPFEQYRSGNWNRNAQQSHRNYQYRRQPERQPFSGFSSTDYDRYYGSPEWMEAQFKKLRRDLNPEWLEQEEMRKMRKEEMTNSINMRANWKVVLCLSIFILILLL